MSFSGLSGLGLGGRCGCHRGGDKLGAGRAARPRAGGDSRPRGAGHSPPALPFSEHRGPGRSLGKHSRGEARARGSGCQWDTVPPSVFRYCGSRHFSTEVPDKGTVPGLTVPKITSQIIV